MPIVFLDINLLLELVDRYDPITHISKHINREVVLKLDVDSPRESFGLQPIEDVIDRIVFKMFEEYFNQARHHL